MAATALSDTLTPQWYVCVFTIVHLLFASVPLCLVIILIPLLFVLVVINISNSVKTFLCEKI